MDCKYIEQLLERYWQCETSLEEEAQLRAFFNGSDVRDICFATKICSYISNCNKKWGWEQISMPVCLQKWRLRGEGKTLDAYRTFRSAVQGRRSSGSGTFIRECDATFIL